MRNLMQYLLVFGQRSYHRTIPMLTQAQIAPLALGLAVFAVLYRARRRHRLAVWLAGIHITRGSAADARKRIEAVKLLVVSCFPETAADLDGGEDVIELLCGFYEPDTCVALFADDQESGLCGLALLFPARVLPIHLFSARKSSLYISTVCVHSSCQRRGLGGRLMRTASAVAADMGVLKLAGAVQASEQPRLLPFYERLGGRIRDNDAYAGDGATRSTFRLEAPSGPVTARGAPAPTWYSEEQQPRPEDSSGGSRPRPYTS